MDTNWSISSVKEYYTEWQQANIIVYLLTSLVFTGEVVTRLSLQGATKFFTGHEQECAAVSPAHLTMRVQLDTLRYYGSNSSRFSLCPTLIRSAQTLLAIVARKASRGARAAPGATSDESLHPSVWDATCLTLHCLQVEEGGCRCHVNDRFLNILDLMILLTLWPCLFIWFSLGAGVLRVCVLVRLLCAHGYLNRSITDITTAVLMNASFIGVLAIYM